MTETYALTDVGEPILDGPLGERRNRCVEIIKSIDAKYSFSRKRLQQKSPTIEFEGWRIGFEHQRSFKSVVLMWLGPDMKNIRWSDDWVYCPESDRNKGWSYRVRLDLQPEAVCELLDL